MSFVVTAALAIALLVAVPIMAHLLRRGRAQEKEFPPAALVPSAPPVARQRSRLEDRSLLTIRGLLLVALALLGAVPLVRCSRLSLAREAGASVALAIVLDDSLSMRTETTAGGSRWDRALGGARDLLRSAREGDAVAIVLAGRPARLLLAATTDLEAARRTLDTVGPADRSTDLASAVQLARSALAELPHVDKRVALLSDLAGDDIPDGEPPLWVPLDNLREPTSNCGVVKAELRGRRVTVTVACSSAVAAQGRAVTVVGATGESAALASASPPGGATGPAPLAPQGGTQTLTLELEATGLLLEARLTGTDGLAHDDRAPVAPEATTLVVAVVADPATSTATTGGAPLLEQALKALETGAQIRPLALVPDEAAELQPFGALVLDDPVGLGPEARRALEQWVERGGVGMVLIGPAVESAQLGATLEPFVTAAVPWAKTDAQGIDAGSAPWLGAEAASLAALAPRGRAVLDGALAPDSQVLARWTDGRPFVVERALGRGLTLAVGLPSGPSTSDFALRPGYLALLGRAVSEAARRRGPRFTVAGSPWSFPGRLPVSITGPDAAALPLTGTDGGTVIHTPTERGRYEVRIGDEVQVRIVTIEADEITRRPRDPTSVAPSVRQGGVVTRVDASRELAIVVFVLFLLEVLVRFLTRFRTSRAT